MAEPTPFDGAKLALLLDDYLLAILRDDTPGLPYAGYWDLPGGGREGDDGPMECALRECHEELGLHVSDTSVIWRKAFHEDGCLKWFFVAKLPPATAAEVVFGDEGQRWSLMSITEFLAHPKAIPSFQNRLHAYLEGEGCDPL